MEWGINQPHANAIINNTNKTKDKLMRQVSALRILLELSLSVTKKYKALANE
jgi:hypothetical protein